MYAYIYICINLYILRHNPQGFLWVFTTLLICMNMYIHICTDIYAHIYDPTNPTNSTTPSEANSHSYTS